MRRLLLLALLSLAGGARAATLTGSGGFQIVVETGTFITYLSSAGFFADPNGGFSLSGSGSNGANLTEVGASSMTAGVGLYHIIYDTATHPTGPTGFAVSTGTPGGVILKSQTPMFAYWDATQGKTFFGNGGGNGRLMADGLGNVSLIDGSNKAEFTVKNDGTIFVGGASFVTGKAICLNALNVMSTCQGPFSPSDGCGVCP